MFDSAATLKRKQSDDIDSPMPSSDPPSPSDSDHSSLDHAKVKRVRTTAETISKKKSVAKLIAALSAEQLINLVDTLVDRNPELADDIAELVPRPTVASVQPLFNSMETKLRESFPYTKWGPGRDDYSFNRVKPVLVELVDTVEDYTNHFTSPSEFPTDSFSYLHMATEVCHRLPEWDNATNNEPKQNLYKSLEQSWIKSIREASNKIEEGRMFGQMTVQEWAK
ncbi:Tethering factor for nuclear proteasome sts1, partial [Mortierella sp. NVP85]